MAAFKDELPEDNLDVWTKASDKIGRSQAVGTRVGSRDSTSAVLSTLSLLLVNEKDLKVRIRNLPAGD